MSFQVGLYLPRNISDHGKIYVALTRVRRPSDIRVVILPDDKQGYSRRLKQWYTQNPVQRSLLNTTEPRTAADAPVDFQHPYHQFYHDVN
jgi:hypothetical protein